MMFVVVLSSDEVFHSMVATSDWQDAIETARARAKEGYETRIYKVPGVMDARAACAAVKMDEGEPVPIPPSAEELAARQKRQEDEHLREKLRVDAAWQVVRERFAEHNALVDANKPGLLKNTETQEIVNERRELPVSGPGSRNFRKRMVQQVFKSQNPDIVARFHEAMKALLTEHGLRPR